MSKKALLVEDDQDYRTQMTMHLKNSGFEVTCAESVAQAKSVLEEVTPDLAVLDLMLDDEVDGGFTLCHHIKKIDEKIPVFLVTGVASETGIDFGASTDEERSWIKADVVLAKPIRFEQLQREIKRFVRE